jgi:uncharacterized protein (TIGR03032 family)
MNEPIEEKKPEQQGDPLRSVHTTNFPEILHQLGISLVVSTYQAGKLIVVRADEGVLNTHFRMFKKPMGIAADHARMALGTANQIWELRNVPAVAAKIEPQGKHDACYLPRNSHITGDIDIHEMAWGEKELWFINTRFSCLCTLDFEYSFIPRWRPPFVSVLTPEDRCHLNGLGMVNGKPKYITALGNSDKMAGWRENKAHGGVLMEIETNEFICQNLSMPHSPRWYGDRLWVLESGNGSIATVDLNNGKLTTVAELPGFTRGIDFWGPLAFIGLSQVRETAVFSGIPITERLQERICGVWVVNIQTGQIVAFLKFEDAVQEIFAVSVLPGIRFPEIIDWDENLLASSYVLPDEALADVPEERKQIIKPSVNYQQKTLQEEYNQAIELRDQQNWSEAIKQFEKVLQIQPGVVEAYYNLGIIYHHQNELEKAIANLQQAVKLKPDFAAAHFNLGMTYLKSGCLNRGFAECEWRWQTPPFKPINCPQPLWDGKEMRGETLLVHTEQSVADTIQFVRYLALAKERCDRVILFCPEDVFPLLETVSGIDKLLSPGTISLSEFQAYIPLMSLPHIFGTTLETIPAKVPYIYPPTNHPLRLRAKPKKSFKVGIAWSAIPTYDSNNDKDSCYLKNFLPLLKIPGISFYSLTTGKGVEELKALSQKSTIDDLSEKLDDLTATAKAISQLDLIITVDTVIAHLAGAMAKPVWLLLSYSPHWRWMLNRNDSPWYPSMRLFRQKQPQDWEGVFKEVEEELKEIAKR